MTHCVIFLYVYGISHTSIPIRASYTRMGYPYTYRAPIAIRVWITSLNRPIRPLQINSLFPVHRPHLVTVSSKYPTIPYSSIISGYSCILAGSVKAILSQCQQCYQLCTNFTFVLCCNLKGKNKLYKHAFM